MAFELKKIPGTEAVEFKEKFVERYSQLTDWEEFRKYSLCFLKKSIRVNTLKKGIAEVTGRLSENWHLKQVPWCKEGFWVEHKKGRLDVGNTVEHMLGYYYVQEAASMIPPVVLGPGPGERVVDIAAAPGSKTSQIAQYMKNKGVVVANDISAARIAALGINLQRCGVMNSVITQMKGEKIRGRQFDRVLLDAPCSGTGTVRKSLKTIQMWNPGMVRHIAGIQRRLIINAYDLVVPGGVLVYSTCSLEPEENEGIIDYLLHKTGAKVEKIELDIRRSPAVTDFEGASYDSEVSKILRIFPQDNDTEGFCVAKIRKPR